MKIYYDIICLKKEPLESHEDFIKRFTIAVNKKTNNGYKPIGNLILHEVAEITTYIHQALYQSIESNED